MRQQLILGFIFSIFSIFLTMTAKAQSTSSKITDRLVQDLECKNVSATEIYSKIRADAYSIKSQIPEKNWSTGYLANCWSLAHAQRIIFMLSRLDLATEMSENKIRGVLDLIRGSSPKMTTLSQEPVLQERTLNQYTVFATDRNFSEGSKLYSLLQQGIEEPGPLKISRNFKRDIEVYEIYRFHRPSNLPMAVGDWERSTQDNQISFQVLKKNIDQHRLGLVVLRGDRTVQHVVIPKRYEIASDGKYIIHVFDSNFPDQETAFAYDPQIQQFEGGSVMGAFYHSPYLTKAVGLFIVDEDEHQKIDEALVRYYQKACQNLKN